MIIEKETPVTSLEGVTAGTWFKAEIKEIPCIGRIQLNHSGYFLCQQVIEGSYCDERFNFPYSWSVVTGSTNDIEGNGVTNLTLIPEPDDFTIQHPLEVNGNTVRFYKGYIEIGCTTVSNELVRQITSKLIDHES